MNGECGLLGIEFLLIVMLVEFSVVLVFLFVMFLLIRLSKNKWLFVLLDIIL